MPIITLQPGPEDEQRIQIEGDVQDRAMQKHGGDQPPILACDDGRIILHPPPFQQIDAATHRLGEHLEEKSDNNDSSQSIGHQGAHLRRLQASPALGEAIGPGNRIEVEIPDS